eukprot:m.308951 g.308951  ORF g.308951 m.308951 type:complete len:169 (+) comp45135_c0_seq1:25-531(+)
MTHWHFLVSFVLFFAKNVQCNAVPVENDFSSQSTTESPQTGDPTENGALPELLSGSEPLEVSNVTNSGLAVSMQCRLVNYMVEVHHPDRRFRRECRQKFVTHMCEGYCKSRTELDRKSGFATVHRHCTCCTAVKTKSFVVPLYCPWAKPVLISLARATRCRCRPCSSE